MAVAEMRQKLPGRLLLVTPIFTWISQTKNTLRARTRLATVWVDIRPLIPGFSWI